MSQKYNKQFKCCFYYIFIILRNILTIRLKIARNLRIKNCEYKCEMYSKLRDISNFAI